MAACGLMIVDDDPVIRGVLRELVEMCLEGFAVVAEAADGREAVALAARLDPDVIVMDIRMPVMDGIQATRRIKHELGLRAVVITATSFGRDEIQEAAFEAGAAFHVQKPFDLEELTRVLRESRAVAQGTLRRALRA